MDTWALFSSFPQSPPDEPMPLFDGGPSPDTFERMLQGLCFVWLGMVAAISFLEAPVKFTAPSLTRPVALDVGRHVFTALNRVELALALLGAGAWMGAQPRTAVTWGLCGVLAILLVQTAWLLPTLNAQAARIIDGGTVTGANYVHTAYGLLEGLKVLGLGAAGWLCGG